MKMSFACALCHAAAWTTVLKNEYEILPCRCMDQYNNSLAS